MVSRGMMENLMVSRGIYPRIALFQWFNQVQSIRPQQTTLPNQPANHPTNERSNEPATNELTNQLS